MSQSKKRRDIALRKHYPSCNKARLFEYLKRQKRIADGKQNPLAIYSTN